ncbi:MAG TPA: hypothetical protein VF378_06725 [Geothrix sp.]
MRVLRSIPALFVLILVACGVGNVNISISPGQAVVTVNTQVQFSASVGNAGNKVVTWAATGGTVDSTGLFTAPASPGTCYVIVTSQADPSKTATAVITVVAPVVITPSEATLAPLATQIFTAVLPATGDTNVTWTITEGAAGGSIDATGLYTAPATEGVFHVIATSVADPTKSATALVTVVAPVAVLPNPANISVNTTQQFTATVRATSSTSVTWSVLEGAIGGTIDATGLYTAPAATGTYHVVAAAVADPTQTGRATVIVGP